jgi:uncharacterized membrane protein
MTPEPFVFIVFSTPLILGLVPRNRFYGLVIPVFTTSSDAIWYHANRVAGIATVIACGLWLSLEWWLPQAMSPRRSALRLADAIGWSSLVVAALVAFWLVYRRRQSLTNPRH